MITRLHFGLFYSGLFYFGLFYSGLFYSGLFYFGLFYSGLFYSGLFFETCLLVCLARAHKSNLKETLRPLGWKGFVMEGLTPNMTRRAQASFAQVSKRCARPHLFFSERQT